MIETVAGRGAVADVLAEPGVDGVYAGPADLGIAARPRARAIPAVPRGAAAPAQGGRCGRAAGKIIGVHAGDELFAAQYAEMGFRLITLGAERSFVRAGPRRHAAENGGGRECAAAGHIAVLRSVPGPAPGALLRGVPSSGTRAPPGAMDVVTVPLPTSKNVPEQRGSTPPARSDGGPPRWLN